MTNLTAHAPRFLLLSLLCAMTAACVETVEEPADEPSLSDAEQASESACTNLLTQTVQEVRYIQNKQVCGTTTEYIYDPIRRPLFRVDTTRTCIELTEQEKLDMCGEDYINGGDEACWLAHVVRLDTRFYACGTSSSVDVDDSSSPEASDDLGSSTYSRTDGCGFDAYGRWRCG